MIRALPVFRQVATTDAPNRASGTWHGEYWARAYDRHGTIALRLTSSPEDASGEVLMIADESGWPYRRYAPTSGATPVEPFTELLTIRFVRAVDGQISGDLEPYWDPDRRCQASATVLGEGRREQYQRHVRVALRRRYDAYFQRSLGCSSPTVS